MHTPSWTSDHSPASRTRCSAVGFVMQDAEGPIFIFAGYLKEMEQFLLTNPGLRSRIGHTFDFADYDVRDLAKIFTREVRSKNLELGSALSEDLLSCILHDYPPARVLGTITLEDVLTVGLSKRPKAASRRRRAFGVYVICLLFPSPHVVG